jgi:hypothetical protein
LSSNLEDQELIAAGDIPAILEATDLIMKYTRHKGDNMQLKDLETYIDALLKFSTFTFVALSKLIDIELAKGTSNNKNIEEINDVLKRIYS